MAEWVGDKQGISVPSSHLPILFTKAMGCLTKKFFHFIMPPLGFASHVGEESQKQQSSKTHLVRSGFAVLLRNAFCFAF